MLKLKVVHIRGPLNPYLTLLSTDVVTWPTMRGLNQPSPVGNRVKRTRPIQASPFYHHQLVHLYLRIFNFSFSSVFGGRGFCPHQDWATPIHSTVAVFEEFCPQIISPFALQIIEIWLEWLHQNYKFGFVICNLKKSFNL